MVTTGVTGYYVKKLQVIGIQQAMAVKIPTKSFMKIAKSVGLRIKPLGTPEEPHFVTDQPLIVVYTTATIENHQAVTPDQGTNIENWKILTNL